MTKEKALAGQTLEDYGMSRSSINVGRMTLKPETKYSVKTCDMIMEKTNASSARLLANVAGRSLPSRSMRASSDSSWPLSMTLSFFLNLVLLAAPALMVLNMIPLARCR